MHLSSERQVLRNIPQRGFPREIVQAPRLFVLSLHVRRKARDLEPASIDQVARHLSTHPAVASAHRNPPHARATRGDCVRCTVADGGMAGRTHPRRQREGGVWHVSTRRRSHPTERYPRCTRRALVGYISLWFDGMGEVALAAEEQQDEKCHQRERCIRDRAGPGRRPPPRMPILHVHASP